MPRSASSFSTTRTPRDFTAEVNKLAAAKPDAIVLVTFAEITTLIPQLTAKGLGPQDVQLYFVDGDLNNYPDEDFDLTGVIGTAPTSATTPGSSTRCSSASPSPRSATA